MRPSAFTLLVPLLSGCERAPGTSPWASPTDPTLIPADDTGSPDCEDPDSDGDGQSDGTEGTLGTDPLDASSWTDGLWVAVPEGCDVEQEITFDLRIRSMDLAFVGDTTGSAIWPDALAAEFGAIASDLGQSVERVAFGLVTFDDYACCGYADPSYGDRVFLLQQQVTTDADLLTAAIARIPNHQGGDGPEGDVEALYQAATGAGYDLDCDGVYDEESDVLPFVASSDDPFGGTAGEGYDPTTPGGGTQGGVGFRDGAQPVLVYATRSDLRDPDAGYPSPGGCPVDAGSDELVAAARALDGILLAISEFGTGDLAQMTDLAVRTGSLGDTDGDGDADDPLVFTWLGHMTTFRNTIVDGVRQALDARTFAAVALRVEGDDHGLVIGLDPESHVDVRPGLAGTTVSFTLTLRGTVPPAGKNQVFPLTLTAIGDHGVRLASGVLHVVVPAESP